MNEIIKLILAVIASLGGAGGVAAIIKQLADAAKVRAEGKKISEDGHAKTQEMLAEIRAAQKAREGKAMEETNILDAMRRVEKCIRERHEDIYLAMIYVKTEEENEYGEPLYKGELTIRTNGHEDDFLFCPEWHFHDGEHHETPHHKALWYGTEDRKGSLVHAGA